MPGLPFTEERASQLQESATKFAQEFGKEYAKMYALAMIQRAEAEVNGEDGDERKLMYRPWNSIERPDLLSRECYMKIGQGPGSYGKWKKVLVVELQDYNLAIYPSGGKGKPLILSLAGYKLAKDVTAEHRYQHRFIANISSQMDLPQSKVDELIQMSPFAWALIHPWRPNYVFQMHKSNNPLCSCFSGNVIDPEGLGSEFDDMRRECVSTFERCITNASARDTETLSGHGFDLTVGKMTSKFERLSDFVDDGTESEILVDMLLQECLTPLKDDMINDLVGPINIRIIMWYKTRALAHAVVQKVANVAWGQMSKVAENMGKKMEPKLRGSLLEPILQAKKDVKQKIREKVSDKIGSVLGQYVSPHIRPLFNALDKPIGKGFEIVKNIYQQKTSVDIPANQKERNLFLDAIARSHADTQGIEDAAREVVAPLEVLKRTNSDIFPRLDPDDLSCHALQLQLETLDAAVYTLEKKMDAGEPRNDCFNNIMEDYDHDVVVARSTFMTNVTKQILFGGFRAAIGIVADPVISDLDGMIPEDIKDFISVAAIFEELVELLVAEPIEKMVESAYPRPDERK